MSLTIQHRRFPKSTLQQVSILFDTTTSLNNPQIIRDKLYETQNETNIPLSWIKKKALDMIHMIIFDYQDKERLELFNNRQEMLSKRLPLSGIFHLIIVILLTLLIQEEEDQSIIPFITLTIIEFFGNIGVIILILRMELPILNTEICNYCRLIATCMIRMILQIYYGPLFPVWILQCYSLIVVLNAYYFNRGSAAINCLTVILLGTLSTVLSYEIHFEYFGNYSLIGWGGIEKICLPCRHFEYIHQCEFSNILKAFTLQSVLCGIGLLFSDVSLEQDERNISQKVEIVKARILNEEKTKFIGHLSHETRNPLVGIMGAAQILKFDLEQCRRKDIQQKSISEKVDDIYNSSVLLLQILSTSLQISSSEMGGVHLQGSEFNMLELVETICSVFNSIAVDRGISLQSFFDVEHIPDMIYGDNTRVSQILMNFVSNSLKYTPNKGRVTLKCNMSSREDFNEFKIDKAQISECMMCYPVEQGKKIEQGDLIFLTFTCRDSGCGMNSNQIINLFATNQQYNPSTSPISKARRTCNDQFIESHGFGLKISKHLIDLMRGKILISSEIGKGTSIKIIIPFFKLEKRRKILEDQIEELRNVSNEKKLSQVIVNVQDQGNILRKYLEYLLPNTKLLNEEVEGEEFIQIQTVDRRCRIAVCSKSDMVTLTNETLFIARPFKVKDIITVMTESMIGEVESIEVGSEMVKIRSTRSIDSLSCNILVVDDNSINRKVVHRLLQIIGYENIDFAVDGLQAFEKFKLSNFQFVLMDLEMPNMNGKESCKLMRKFENENEREPAEIFALTGNMSETKETCTDFDNILFKPISIDSLRQILGQNKNSD